MLADPRRRRSSAGRGRVPRSNPALVSAEPSPGRRGPSLWKVCALRPAGAPARGRRTSAPAGTRSLCRVPSAVWLRPVPRVPEPNDPPAVLLVRPVVGRLAVLRVPSAAEGRAARLSPAAARGRAVRWVVPSPRAAVSPRARSGEDVRVVRRGPSPLGVRGARRGPSLVAPSRPAPVRPVRGCCPERPDADRPRLVDPLVPADLGLFPEFLAPVPEEFLAPVPVVARDVFGIPLPARPPLLRPPPLVPRPLGVPRPSATLTNLQHLPPQYPDKRRGSLDHIGSDPLQACPAASYSPTRSPAQYHRR